MEKERRTKALVLSALVIVVATLSIAFAAMSRTLSINGYGKMDTASWSVYFDNLSEPTITRGAQEVSSPSISDDKGTVQDINVKLSNPKDEISYTVDIVNDGTIDAQVMITPIIQLSEEEQKVLEYGVYYSNGTQITKYDLLEAGKKIKITIKIKYRDDITEEELPTESLVIDLGFTINYVQSDASVIIKPNGDYQSDQNGGYIFDGVESVLAGYNEEECTSFNVGISYFLNERVYGIESITFLDNMKVPEVAKGTAWDASQNKDGSVVGWYLNEDDDDGCEVYIGGNGKVIAPESCRWLFTEFNNGLKTINFNGVFDTSRVTDMREMFSFCFELVEIKGMSFDTSNVTKMGEFENPEGGMFNGCSSLTNLDLSSFDTSKVTNMSYMFSGCESLTNLDLSNFNTSNVTDMSGMFIYCSSLTSLDLSSFDTSNVTTMESMFSGCTSLISLDLSSFDTSNVTDMSGMFVYCSSLTSLDLSSFDTSNVTTMVSMFYRCSSLTSLDLSNFNTSNVTDMQYMFNGCSSLTSLDLSNFNTSNVTYMQYMFNGCSSLTNLDLRNADFSSVTGYTGMFSSVPTTSQIIVKDEIQRTWLTSKFTNLTNVVLPSEL